MDEFICGEIWRSFGMMNELGAFLKDADVNLLSAIEIKNDLLINKVVWMRL